MASEIFGARDCDCADQLRESMRIIAEAGSGMIFHLFQEGRGHGLSAKLRAVRAMQLGNVDTFDAFEALGLHQDVRAYGDVAGILQGLGVRSVRLITNNPRKRDALLSAGIDVEMVGTRTGIRPATRDYLATKNRKLGHLIPLEPPADEVPSEIRFYHSDQPWGFLSNFSRHPILLDGRIWPTVEHFYQAKKFAGTADEEAIRLAETPTEAKQHSERLGDDRRREDWDSVKERIMLRALRAKFRQHPELGERLVATAGRRLVEHSEGDAYWGNGGTGAGLNRLGEILMEVRAELIGPSGGAKLGSGETEA
jgi:GTP cyclohydrolase II